MENINIVFITDNDFSILTGVAIYSLKKHRNDNCVYNINIICNNVDNNYISKFNKLKSKNFKINIIKVDGTKYENLKKDNLHVSTTALFKFDLPNIFQNLDKILYIDGDVLFQSDLCELYNTDISSVYAGVCVDYGGLIYPSDFKSRLKIKHKYYFNSGMLLLNLKRLRKDNIPKKLIEYRLKKNNYYMDQDAFNVVFRENVKYLSLNYNFVITCWRDYDESVLTDFYKLKKQDKMIDYLLNADIVHFASADKPSKYEDVPLADLWLDYFKESTFNKIKLKRLYLKKINPVHIYFTKESLKTKETDKIDAPCISVIIPIYNARNFIVPTLNSVLSQDLKFFEVICVDDGSTDGTYERLEQLAKEDSRIKLFKQKNQFAGVARNNGITMATGDYIVFLDSDDKLEKHALVRMYKKAISEKADIVLTGAYYLDDVTKVVSSADFCLRMNFLPSKTVFSADDVPQYIFNLTGGNPWAKCYKREFILKYNLKFLPIKRSEDFYFVCLSLIYAKRITVLPDRLFFYRINNAGSLESTKDETPLIFWDANTILYNYLKEHNLFDKYKQSFLNDSLNRMAYNLKQVKTVTSLEMIFKLLKTEGVKLFDFDTNKDDYWYFKSNLAYIKYFLSLNNLMQYFNDLLEENRKLKKALSKYKNDNIKTKINYSKNKKESKLNFKQKLKLAKKRGIRYCFIRLFKGRDAGDKYLTKKGLW